uniref:Ionotropic glutamate receptor L-glutamate and glycine-binding domain-containing protein n=1 Tax=Anopheles culicifacies TaxID=139723 RepID=A0A182LZL1_9DIPT
MTVSAWKTLLLVGVPLTLAAIQQSSNSKPFLQRLIEDGFKTSDINVVYFITGNDADKELFWGNYPRVLIPALAEQSKAMKSKNPSIQIAAQSLVVVDARKEPVEERRCLIYLLKELQRIDNPGSNKFVLLVSQGFYESSKGRNTLQYLHDGLINIGIGYSMVLSYDQRNSPKQPVLMTRITFGHKITTGAMRVINFRYLFRLDIRSLDGFRITGVLHNFLPFSYIQANGLWAGIDFHLWSEMAGQLRLRLKLIHAKPGTIYVGGAYSPAMRNMSVDFIATRDVFVLDGGQKLILSSRDYFSLIVPKPITLNLIDALLQPFRREVWLLVGLLMGIRSLIAHLHIVASLIDNGGIMHNRLRDLLAYDFPWFGWIKLAWNVLTFLLIEAYLAQVTSFLLTLRYIEGPKTLDEFLASNILIVKPSDQSHSLVQIESAQKTQLLARFVKRTREELARPDLADAYVELRSRVMFLTYGSEPIDPVTGKRNYYILNEPLADVRFQYSFAKQTAFMMVAERCFLWYEENGMRKRLDDYYERWAKIQHVRKQHGINGTVLGFTDLNSLWICTMVGWCVSALVFFIERVLHSRMRNRRMKRKFLH